MVEMRDAPVDLGKSSRSAACNKAFLAEIFPAAIQIFR